MAAGPLRGGKMGLQLTDDEGRQPDGSPAGARLGRAGDQLSSRSILGSGTLRQGVLRQDLRAVTIQLPLQR